MSPGRLARFGSKDGAYIAYQVVGKGSIDVAWQLDFGGNLDVWWESDSAGRV
jgi:hypothetical protein